LTFDSRRGREVPFNGLEKIVAGVDFGNAPLPIVSTLVDEGNRSSRRDEADSAS
jgi:hypothetical protein